jgi:hypothetical protein
MIMAFPAVRAIDLGIDSIAPHPGMIMIGHRDRERIDRRRQAATNVPPVKPGRERIFCGIAGRPIDFREA